MKRISVAIVFLLFVFTAKGFTVAGEAEYKLGLSYYKQKKFLLSVGAFKKALKNGYNEPVIYFYLGNSLRQTDKYQDAIENFIMANEMSTNRHFKSIVMYNMGTTYYATGDFTNSVKIFEKSYRINKKLGSILWLKGLAYYRMRDKENTIVEWENYLAILPKGRENDNIRKVLAILKATDFEFPKPKTTTDSTNDTVLNTEVELVDIEGVLDEVKPDDKGMAEDTEMEDIEK